MFDALISKYAAQYNVPSLWIRAVILRESSGNPDAFSGVAYGLMQLTLDTARRLGFSGEPNDLFNPDTNIRFGAQLLGQLRRSYGDNLERIYSAYYSGNPDAFRTRSDVADVVTKFLKDVQTVTTTFVTDQPVIAGAGTAVVAAVVLLLVSQWRTTH